MSISMQEKSMACPNCKDPTALFQKNIHKVNHWTHFVLTLFTGGFWLIIWIALVIGASSKNSENKWQCAKCGMLLNG